MCGGDKPSMELTAQIVKNADLIIGVDKGVDYLCRDGFFPDICIGDFDSADSVIMERMKNFSCEIIRHTSEKDYTDSELAVDHAVKCGCVEIVMLAATGNRMDHSLANIQLMEKALCSNVIGILADDNNTVYLMKESFREFESYGRKYFSLLPITDKVTGITLKNAKYPLVNAVIERGHAIGVSNEPVDHSKPVGVEIKSGKLLVVFSD